MFCACRSAALLLDPDHTEFCATALSNRAAASLAMGRFKRALDDSTGALERRPGLVKTRLRRARAHMALGSYTAAVEDFELVQAWSEPRRQQASPLHVRAESALPSWLCAPFQAPC